MAKTSMLVIPDDSGTSSRGGLLNELRSDQFLTGTATKVSVRVTYIPPVTKEVEAVLITINTGVRLDHADQFERAKQIALRYGFKEK